MRHPRPTAARHPLKLAAAAALALMSPLAGMAADTDIYGAKGNGAAPNVMFLLDNTSNWSTNNQDWNSGGSWSRCSGLAAGAAKTQCQNLIEAIYYEGIPTNGPGSKKRPWDGGYNNNANQDGVALTQGQVQLRALKLVLNQVVCSGATNALKINVGVAMIGDSGSVLSTGHATGFIRFAVQPLTGTATSSGTSCKALIDDFNQIDSKITNPTFKAPSNANYGAAMYEIFKYFGGHSNPTLAGNAPPNGGTPVGATGYGPTRFSRVNTLDDPAAFTDSGRGTYKSPLTAASACGNNYIVLVGNTYPNAEANNGGPTIFSGIGYTPPTLSAVSSDTGRFADEWAYFLANTDVSSVDGVQRVFTYAVNTYNAKPDAGQTKLLKSMAAAGGIGAAGYLEVGGDLVALVNGFRDILLNVAAVNSVFTATTLPVSTTTQGTFLNQIFVGMFRPDGTAGPRWFGNLKQYELGMINNSLELVDQKGKSAVLSGVGLFAPGASSFWTEGSVFFDAAPSGTPPSASDDPDGSIVEKGGAAQQLRKTYLQDASTRNVKTVVGTVLGDFNAANTGLSAAMVSWVRGENNVSTGTGVEAFNGSYTNAGVTTALGSTGARHSIHGDVLHSRPVALNYGGSNGVTVYYGSNDGFFRAVNGNKTGTGAGQELWSFVAPEHFPMLTRLRDGVPSIHVPETDSSGATLAPTTGTAVKDYGMDGPIGVYARYNSGATAVTQALIYPTMRRGGRNVYGFDVTTPSSPSLAFKITGGSGSYTQLAQTWSMPKAVVFSSSGSPGTPILLMGGGYDPSEDSNSSSGIGNVIYVINGLNGNLIKALTTDYSVPSDVTVVDVDADGEPDRAYVADVRGNLYRVDFPSGDKSLAASWTSTTAQKIASLGGKVFYAPDVVVTKNFVSVLIGTGDREKPLLVSTSDKFFHVKDNLGTARNVVLTTSDLTRVAQIDNATMAPTNVATTAVNDPEGCYIELATNGEKVVNAPFSIAGVTYFGTNRPTPSGAPVCSADLGQAYAYKFPLFCGTPSKPVPIAGGGLPPSPVGGIVTVNVNGVDQKLPFIIGSGEGNSAFKPAQPTPPVPPVRSRLNWRIDNTNR